jgi:histone deacetylase complex regulatory component SIN3
MNVPQQGGYHAGPADANAPFGMMNTASPSTYPIVSSSGDMMISGRPGDHGLDQQTEFQRAIAFVNKIKNRYAGEPETYKTFLELLQSLRDGTKSDVSLILLFHDYHS